MTHPSETLLQAFLDEEITPAVTEDVERHLRSCGVCRASAEELLQLSLRLREVVRHVDAGEPEAWTATPHASWREEEARRRQRPQRRHRQVLQIPRRSVTRDDVPRPRARVWQWAAVILVSVTGIASAAMIVAPWLRTRSEVPVASPPPVPRPPAPNPAAGMNDAGAIAVAPVGGEMSVTLDDAGEGSRVFVRLADRADVFVSLKADSLQSDPAVFRSGDARVEVELANRVMMVYVEFPRSLRSGRVLAGDQVVARVSGSKLEPPGATADGILIGSGSTTR